MGICHPAGHPFDLLVGRCAANRPVHAGTLRQMPTGGIEWRQPTLSSNTARRPPMCSAAVCSRVSMFHDGQLRGAAADVDVQNRAAAIVDVFAAPEPYTASIDSM